MTKEIKSRIEQIKSRKVPQGYKQSHAGIIPTDWDEAKISDVATELTETAGDRKYETLSISAGSGFVNQAQKFGKELSGKQYEKYIVLHKGDFSYNKGNSNAYPQGCIYCLNDREKAAVPNVFESFRIKKGNPDYYEQLFISGYLNKQLYSKINHGVRDDGLLNLTGKDFYSCFLPIFSLLEQQKIADILAQCDKVIALKKARIEEEKKQKKWLMQNLLDPNSGVRLPGFENSKWENFELRVLGRFSKGAGISNDDCTTGKTPCVKYGDIYMSYNAWFNKAVSATKEEIAALAPKVEKGALLFTCSGEDPIEIGKCTAYLGDKPIAVGGDIAIMIPDVTRILSLFLAYGQYTYGLIKQKARSGQGYSIVHLYPNQIKKLSVSIPLDVEEQKKIVSILLASENEISLLQQELSMWQQKKKALMQLLLTGIVRIKK